MLNDGETKVIKLNCAGYKFPVTMTRKGSRIWLSFPFSKALQAEIKSMQGAKWHGFENPPIKQWSIAFSFRNLFQIRYLMGENPYEWYDQPIKEHLYSRSLMGHQKLLANTGLTHHYVVWASEMGTGKTLAAIEVAERSGYKDIWYVGPRSGVKAVGLELQKWKCQVKIRMMTYENLVRVIKEWVPNTKAPQMVIFDECSKIKTPTTQRSQAAFELSEGMRKDWGIKNSICILMSGTPAPKSPVDWWNLAEVACPGWFKEGDPQKFKARMCLIEQKESLAGGMYPHLVTWLDDERKCAVCGQLADHTNHMMGDRTSSAQALAALQSNRQQGFTFGGGAAKAAPIAEMPKDVTTVGHVFKKSVNEVAFLHERMKGLVTTLFKKDCIDLPDKQYRIIQIPPTVDMIRAGRILTTKSRSAIQALTLLRELSDGFQYEDIVVGQKTCPVCCGLKEHAAKIPINCELDPDGNPITRADTQYELKTIPCETCDQTGLVDETERAPKFVGTPKDEALVDILEDHEEVGRHITWGGFSATIDRIVELSHKNGWSTLRVDGRGYHASDPLGNPLDPDELLKAMDASYPTFKELREKHDRINFVGNPKAGGMALTLTASPTETFYSNDFSGEARMQAEDRFHRPGADSNRGCTINDIICMPSDLLVLENLRKKKRLQDLTLGEINEHFSSPLKI